MVALLPSSKKTMKGVAMVILSISVSTKPHKRNELLSALSQLIDTSEKEVGCKLCHIYQEIDDPNLINVEEIWANRTDLDAYFYSDIFGALLGAIKLLGQFYEIRINDDMYTEGMDAIEGIWSKQRK